MYCRSFHPIALEKKPDAVEVAEAVEERGAVAHLRLGPRGPGDVVEDLASLRLACASTNVLPEAARAFGVEPGEAAAHRQPRVVAASRASESMKSMNSGTSASVALPERSSRGMMLSASTRTVRHSCGGEEGALRRRL